jgi:flagellar motor switch protein FliG
MATSLVSSAQGATMDTLNGVQRAAVILLALGPDRGKPIWDEMEEDEIRAISQAMAQLGPVEAETVEKLITEFAARISEAGAVNGNFDRTEKLLASMLPKQQVESIMEDIRRSASRSMWQKLSNVEADLLTNYLSNEYPQTIAVVLSKLDSALASKVLGMLEEDLALDVMNRMLKMDNVKREALEHIELTLRNEFVNNVVQTAKVDPHELLAEMFNSFDRQTEARFMGALEAKNKDSAKRIRALMFTFDDLAKLDAASIQTLMRSIDKDLLAKALKGAREPVKEFFFKNMSSRAAKNLQDEIAGMGPMRIKDIEEAQDKMINVTKGLAERGDIMIAKNREEDALVY